MSLINLFLYLRDWFILINYTLINLVFLIKALIKSTLTISKDDLKEN